MRTELTELLNHFVSQIIITSKFWRPVHQAIYYNQTEDFLIFGTALDLAIAANTKFDVMFIDKKEMSTNVSQNYKLRLVLGTFKVQLEMLQGTSKKIFFPQRKLSQSMCQNYLSFATPARMLIA